MTPQELIGWAGAVITGLIGATLVYLILIGKIDLAKLLVETGDQEGKASLAKLQLLIFTFVIALSLFAITIEKKEFPKIDANIMVLLGISAGTSLASTGVAAATRVRLAEVPAGARKERPDAVVADL